MAVALMAAWTITDLRKLADTNGWQLELRPDPDKGNFVKPHGLDAEVLLHVEHATMRVAIRGAGISAAVELMGESLEAMGVQRHG